MTIEERRNHNNVNTMNIEHADSEAYDDDGHEKRTGTMLTASSHIITAVIGSGVLSLAWATAQLGWIAGPTILLTFAMVTYMSSMMLADCYRYPHPVTGRRNYTYSAVVDSYLGGMNIYLCRIAQLANCSGTTVGYTITASISMVAIMESNCYHKNGHGADCDTKHLPYMIGFGVIQLVLSQLPNFHKLSFLSMVAAVMSFSYASIGFALSIAKVISDGAARTSLTGTEIGVDVTRADKLWSACQAVGDMAFSYAFSMVLVEIQDTLKSSPSENKVMKTASAVGIATTTMFYLLCGCIGYAAFGNKAPGNFLTDFGFYEPFWLVDFANICIVVHLIGAYQVFVQPVFSFIENIFQKACPESGFINREYPINIPCTGVYPFNWFRLVYRTIYVIITVIIALIFPFFNSFLGLLGAGAFFPLTVYFPIQMHIVQRNVKSWTLKWIVLKVIIVICFMVSFMSGVGSIQGLISHVKGFSINVFAN